MAWKWTYHAPDGVVVTPPPGASGAFPTQAEAESWLGETWTDLLAAGVESVSLTDDDRVVYGPMGLRSVD